jgi:AcrR family transcriptional regulator
VYKHFDSKSALLVATAKRALESLPYDDPELDPPARARAVARSFLAPSAAPVRRFVAELAVAAPRDGDLLALMGQWHRERITTWPHSVASTTTGRASVKALYMLLLGACQLDVLAGIDASPRRFATLIEDAAAALFE